MKSKKSTVILKSGKTRAPAAASDKTRLASLKQQIKDVKQRLLTARHAVRDAKGELKQARQALKDAKKASKPQLAKPTGPA